MTPSGVGDLRDSGDWPSDDGDARWEPTPDQGREPAPDRGEEPDAKRGGEPDRLCDVLLGGPLHAYRVAGSLLGAYVIEAEIARGGMGRVYRARHRELERTVALKVLLAGVDASPSQRERFLREATVGASLLHPGIVRVHDYGDEDGLAYLALEYVPGETLHTQMPGLSRDALLQLLVRVGEALGHAHDAGVVHRDLKPANILLREDGAPVVTDFGLARDLRASSGLTKSGAALGTPAYMAPEQTRGGTPTPATDVFGLGVLLYQGLTGGLPFEGATIARLYVEINALDPPAPHRLDPTISAVVSDVCLRALAKRPADRFTDGAAFARALEAARRGVGLRRPSRASKLLLGGLLILCLGVAAGVATSAREPRAPGVAASTSSADPAPGEPQAEQRLLAPSDPIPDVRGVRYSDGGRMEGRGWISVHGLDPKALEAQHQELTTRGFGLDTVGVNTQTRVPRFAGVWRRDDGLRRLARINIGQFDYSREWHTRKDQGWRQTLMIRWGGDSPRFLGLWRSGGTERWQTLPTLPLVEARRRYAVALRQGLRVVSIAATPGEVPTFTVVWVDDGLQGRAVFSRDAKAFGAWLTRASAAGFRPTLIQAHGPASSPRFAGVVVRDDRRALTFHGLRPTQYQRTAEVLVRSGYEPVSIAEYGVRRGQRRVSSCWVRDASPAIWRVTGPDVPGLAQLDDLVRAAMRRRGVTAAALAVVQGRRLVYARGYTLAPVSQAPTSPTTLFRLGDLSQAITAVGILRLVEGGQLDLDQTLSTLFPDVKSPEEAYADARLGRVTIRQLLAHRGGWDREGARSHFDSTRGYQLFDPTLLMDDVVAAGLQIQLPLAAADIMRFMHRQPLEFDPGSRYARSSYGYLILGRVIEVVSGHSYARALKALVLERLGTTRFTIGDGRLARRVLGEAIHESERLSPDAFGEGAVVPVHYGGQNLRALASCAGWLGSAVDVARLLAALSDPKDSPLLSEASIRTMWTPPAGGHALGWEVSGPAGDPRASADGGRRQGSWGHMERGPEGLSFILLFNRQSPAPSLVSALRAALRRVEAWPSYDLFER